MQDKETQTKGEIDDIQELSETLASIPKEEYERIRSDALKRAKEIKHAWVQKSPGQITCTSCEFPHRAYIDPKKELIGIDESGLPVFRNVV